MLKSGHDPELCQQMMTDSSGNEESYHPILKGAGAESGNIGQGTNAIHSSHRSEQGDVAHITLNHAISVKRASSFRSDQEH